MGDSLDFSTLPEDEGYIYLDAEGRVQPTLEITVMWTHAPNKPLLVPISKSDHFEVLPLKIAERLEKYPLFAGLSCLQAVNITWANGERIPSSGSVGKVLKSGDTLLCDLTSKDMWLTVRLEVPSLSAFLNCDIKVDCDASVSSLRLALYDVAVEVLSLQDCHSPEDMQLTQIPQFTHRLSASAPVEQGTGGRVLDPEWLIRDCFDFVSCYVTGYLPARAGIQTWLTHCNSAEIKSTPIIRKVCIEDMTVRPAIKRVLSIAKAESQCGGCEIC